jgi:hypothetical protein
MISLRSALPRREDRRAGGIVFSPEALEWRLHFNILFRVVFSSTRKRPIAAVLDVQNWGDV